MTIKINESIRVLKEKLECYLFTKKSYEDNLAAVNREIESIKNLLEAAKSNMFPENSNEQRILKTISKATGFKLSQLELEKPIYSLSMDSLDTIEMIMMLEDEFEIDLEDIDHLSSQLTLKEFIDKVISYIDTEK